MAELHHQTEHCEFANLKIMLKDHFVCGVHDSHIQLKLLVDTNLTILTTYVTTQAVEAADKQVKTLHNNDSTIKPANRVKMSGQPNANGSDPLL